MNRFIAVSVLVLTLACGSATFIPTEANAQSALQKGKTEAASRAYKAASTGYTAGTSTVDQMYVWSIRWLDSAISSGVSSSTAFADHKKRMKELSELVKSQTLKGASPRSDLKFSEYYRLEADLWATYGKK